MTVKAEISFSSILKHFVMLLELQQHSMCTFAADELFSDSFPVELVDGVVYKVKGKVCYLCF